MVTCGSAATPVQSQLRSLTDSGSVQANVRPRFPFGQSSRRSRPDAEVISASALIHTRARVTKEPKQSRSQFITGSARAEWAQVQHHQCEHTYACVWEMSGAQGCGGESEHEAKRLCTRNESHDRSDPAEGGSAAVVSYSNSGSAYSLTHDITQQNINSNDKQQYTNIKQ